MEQQSEVKQEIIEPIGEPEEYVNKSDMNCKVEAKAHAACEPHEPESLKIITNLCTNLQTVAEAKEATTACGRRSRKAAPQKQQKENSVQKNMEPSAINETDKSGKRSITAPRQLRSSQRSKPDSPKPAEEVEPCSREETDSDDSVSLQELASRKRMGTKFKNAEAPTKMVDTKSRIRKKRNCDKQQQHKGRRSKTKETRAGMKNKGQKTNENSSKHQKLTEMSEQSENDDLDTTTPNEVRLGITNESSIKQKRKKSGAVEDKNSITDAQTSSESDSDESDGLQEFLDAVEPKKPKYKPRRKPQLSEEQKAERERKSIEKRTCKVCSMVFAFPGGLRNHMRSKHTFEKPYSCEFCGEKFAIQSSYSLHRRRHLGIKPHLCNLCGKTFLRKMDMRIHMRIHVPFKDKVRDVKCSFCPKVYTSKINLRKHTLTKHTDPSEWKHECRICGKKLYSATALTLHVRQHNDDRSFKCVICGRGFFTKQNMNIHVRTHSANTPFNCELCHNGYRSNEALQRHMLKVHGIGEEKPVSAPSYFCPVCHEGFRQRARLEQHVELHETGEEEYPFECEKCHKRYKARNYFTIHMMDKHGIMIDESYFKTFQNYRAASDTASLGPDKYDYSDPEDMEYKISESSNSELDDPNE